MNDLFNGLKQNKAFKLFVILIFVFFSVLVYFNKVKAVTCQCNEWTNCKWEVNPYGAWYDKTCSCSDTQYSICLEADGTAPICGSGYYVCNRESGCCPIAFPTPEPWVPSEPAPGDPEPGDDDYEPPICVDSVWSICSDCGGPGVQISDCGNQRPCTGTSPSCGGATCDMSADPNKVTGIQVNGAASGNLNLTSSPNLNITWNDPGTTDPAAVITYYYVQVWDKSEGTTPPYPCDATSNCAIYTTAGKVESYTTPAVSDHGNDVYVTVRAVNDVCVSVGYGSWSDDSSFGLVADVSGSFYNDQSGSPDAFNNCNSASTEAVDLSPYTGTTVVSSAGGTSGGIGTSYSISDVPYAPTAGWADYGFDIMLTIDNSSDPLNSIVCSCPIDLIDAFLCRHTDTASPSSNENIFLASKNLSNGPWWQASGGNIYGASSLISSIPTECEDDAGCAAYIVTQNSDADAKSAGIPITGASSFVSNGYFTERGASEPRAVDSNHSNLIRENYSYFSRGVSLATANTISGTITAVPTGATPDADNTEIYYSNGDLIIDISSTENVTGDRKVVVFVNGNLTFTSSPDTEMITVDQGSFISFISSGDITFEANVGNSNQADSGSNIAGVFIADGTINVDGYSEAPLNDDSLKDNKFVGEGTFVGWSGFNLTRDYENTTSPVQKELNNLYPIEVFIFRPDFNTNIPSIMMKPSLVWQEVN